MELLYAAPFQIKHRPASQNRVGAGCVLGCKLRGLKLSLARACFCMVRAAVRAVAVEHPLAGWKPVRLPQTWVVAVSRTPRGPVAKTGKGIGKPSKKGRKGGKKSHSGGQKGRKGGKEESQVDRPNPPPKAKAKAKAKRRPNKTKRRGGRSRLASRTPPKPKAVGSKGRDTFFVSLLR